MMMQMTKTATQINRTHSSHSWLEAGDLQRNKQVACGSDNCVAMEKLMSEKSGKADDTCNLMW